MKTIAVLLSTYNGELYLEKQLESLYNQAFSDDYRMQIVIRDDGSQDRTDGIIEQWSKRLEIQYIKGKNCGAKSSFYELLYNAPVADYYAFCDQDDIWKEDKLAVALNKLETCEGAALYFCNLEYIDENDVLLNCKQISDEFKLSFERILMCNPANGCTMVWNRKLQEIYLLHKYEVFTMHDEFAITVAYLAGSVIYDHRCKILYRIHKHNVTLSKDLRKKFKIWKWVWFGNRYATLDKRAKALLTYIPELRENDKKMLYDIMNYKRGINRFNLLRRGFRCEHKKIERSFRIRMLLGVL